jgi:hypothetical protein
VEPLLVAAQVTAIVGVNVETLALWRSTGRGPRFGRKGAPVRYRRADVERWISALADETVTREEIAS